MLKLSSVWFLTLFYLNDATYTILSELCERPRNGTNAIVHVTGLAQGDSCSYKCSPGHERIHGDDMRTCERRVNGTLYWTGETLLCKEIPHVTDCLDVLKRNSSAIDGVYELWLNEKLGFFQTVCDMTNGGWTVIQQRRSNADYFDHDRHHFYNGFGNIDENIGNFWLGLKKMAPLAHGGARTAIIRIELKDWNGNTYFAQYNNVAFALSYETGRLTIGDYDPLSTAGDGLSQSNQTNFSDKSFDYSAGCHQADNSGWWFPSSASADRPCGQSNLNGPYLGTTDNKGLVNGTLGMFWYTLRNNSNESLQGTRMMLKRHGCPRASELGPQFRRNYLDSLISSNFTLYCGDYVNVICKEGYKDESNTDSIRLENGQYVGSLECRCYGKHKITSFWRSSCKRVECGPPQVINNTLVVGSTFFYGDTVTYSCETGYVPATPGVNYILRCNWDGVWDGEKPRCIENMTSTTGPTTSYPVNSNQSYTSENSTTVLPISENQTNPGFAHTEFYTECPDSWTQYGDTPYCYRFFTERFDWHRAQNYCRSAYGGNLASVNSPGMSDWISELHRETVHEPSGWFWIGLNDEHGEGTWRTPTGAEAKYFRWQAGQPNEHTYANCIGVGAGMDYLDTNYTWYDRQCDEWWNFVCEIRIGCPVLDAVPHVTFSYSGFTPNDTVTYACHTGYHVTSGDLARVCTKNATWTGEPPMCDRIVCWEPPMVNNGSVIYTGDHFGDRARYMCDEGLSLLYGDDLRYCIEDGQWSGLTPYCVPNDVNSRGAIIRRHVCEGTIMTITCDPGKEVDILFAVYGHLIGTDIYCPKAPTTDTHCEAEHSLEKSRSFCIGKSTCDVHAVNKVFGKPCRGTKYLDIRYRCIGCAYPREVEHSEVGWSGLRLNEIANYTCHAGYYISAGDDVMTCTSRGYWNGSLPTCSRISCGHLGIIDGSTVINVTGHLYGDAIHIVCNYGYHEGESVRVCQANGSWSGDSLVCQRVSCGRPDPGVNTRMRGQFYVYGSKVHLECFFGYEYVNGSKSRTCKADGAWTGVEHYCQEKAGPPANEIKPQWKEVPKDEAPGSDAIGSVALILVVGFLAFIVLLDLATCAKSLQLMRKNLTYWQTYFKERRNSKRKKKEFSDIGLTHSIDFQNRQETAAVSHGEVNGGTLNGVYDFPTRTEYSHVTVLHDGTFQNGGTLTESKRVTPIISKTDHENL